MSADKYPNIFSPQMESIVYISLTTPLHGYRLSANYLFPDLAPVVPQVVPGDVLSAAEALKADRAELLLGGGTVFPKSTRRDEDIVRSILRRRSLKPRRWLLPEKS